MADPGRLIASGAAPALAVERRSDEAHAVRDRLPLFLRRPPLPELLLRVDARLVPAIRRWTWGAPGVLLLGPTRVGKSTAAAVLFRALLARGVSAGGDDWDRAVSMRWFGAEALGAARREHPLGQGDAPEVLQACAASLLFLDDAGWDKDPSVVSEVIDARYERGRPTIVTSGKNREELTKHYGAAVVRRLNEAGGKLATVVECFR